MEKKDTKKENEKNQKKGIKYSLCRISFVGFLTLLAGASFQEIYNITHDSSIEKENDDLDDEMFKDIEDSSQLNDSSELNSNLESDIDLDTELEDLSNTEFGNDFNTEYYTSDTKSNNESNKPSGNNKSDSNKPSDNNKPSDDGKTDDDDKPFHLFHNFDNKTVTYVYENNSKHVKIIEGKCSCGETSISRKVESCNYGSWVSNGASGEKRECPDCHHAETRNHSIDKKINYIDNNNGTHTVQTIETCTTCDYKNETIKTISCNYGPWVSMGAIGEKRECPICHHTETRNHKLSIETKYIDNNNGTHTVQTIETCINCDYKNVTSKTVSCNYGSWVSNGAIGEKRECPDCHHTETRNHNITKKTDYIDNKNGTHTVQTTESCSTCDYKNVTSKTASCSYGNGVLTGEYQYNNDGTHSSLAKKTCTICGNEKTYVSSTENCDLSGEKVTGSDGVTVTVTCPKCHHDTVVHTHHWSNPVWSGENDPQCTSTITCPECGQSIISHVDHDYQPTSEIDPLTGEVMYKCSRCNATKWVSNEISYVDILMDDIDTYENKPKTLVKKRNNTCC